VTGRATTIAGPARNSDRLYRDLLAPEEIRDLRLRVRAAASRVIAPVAARVANQDERIDGFPRDVFDGLAPRAASGSSRDTVHRAWSARFPDAHTARPA
jgi:hypothetical protein